MFIYENGGFRKRFPEWRLLKTQVYRFSVDGKNGAFQKRLRHNSLCKRRQHRWRYWSMRIEQKKTSEQRINVFQLRVCTFENASVDAELFIRFWVTKNGGFQKRISVDLA